MKKNKKKYDQFKRFPFEQPQDPYPGTLKFNEGCGHSFPLLMVIPPGGCYFSCPICGARNFVRGTEITCSTNPRPWNTFVDAWYAS